MTEAMSFQGAVDLCAVLTAGLPYDDLVAELRALVEVIEDHDFVLGCAWAASEHEIDRLSLKFALDHAEARIAELEQALDRMVAA